MAMEWVEVLASDGDLDLDFGLGFGFGVWCGRDVVEWTCI